MNTITFTLILIIAVSPGIITWFNEYRLRKLSEAKLKISKATTAMERHMLRGDISRGGVCHDLLFPLMIKTQALHKYPVSWELPLFKSKEKSYEEFTKRLHQELSNSNSPVANHLNDFIKGYFQAFRYNHIILCPLYILYVLIMLGGLRIILTSLKGIKTLLNLSSIIMSFITEKYVAQTYNLVVNDEKIKYI